MFIYKNFKADLLSGFFVSMLALPLSLGIATASGFPPVAGLIAAIIGGVIGAAIGGCALSIKGPAAGLIVLVYSAVHSLQSNGDLLSGYRRTLAVIVIAGVLQIVLSRIHFSNFVDLIPTSIIHGMLAAIGIIVISKQFPIMLGNNYIPNESPFAAISHFPKYIYELNPMLAALGIFALLLMFSASSIKKIPLLKSVPVILLIVIPAVIFSALLGFGESFIYSIFGQSYSIDKNYLVQLPTTLISSIVTPDWSHIYSWISLEYVVLFALVGSIESLLTVSAVDSLTNQKKKSNHDRDLLSIGLANICSGLIGGLPMISEVARSKANVDAGAVSAKSNFFHGLFIFLFIIFLPQVLALLPLACLAGMLVYIGFRLASPAEFKHMWKIGPEQLGFFLVTCIATLLSDLLLGVLAGLTCAYIFAAYNARSLTKIFSLRTRIREDGEKCIVRVNGPATFLNCRKVKSALQNVEHANKRLSWDFSHANFVDHTFIAKINEYSRPLDEEFALEGFKAHTPLSKHPFCSRIKSR